MLDPYPQSEIYQKDPSIVSRKIADEVILVPIRQHVGDLESIFTLNETAATAWVLIDGQHSLAEISEQIVSEYEVSLEQAQSDVLELVQELVQIGAIRKI